jgi:hypothetical protein
MTLSPVQICRHRHLPPSSFSKVRRRRRSGDTIVPGLVMFHVPGFRLSVNVIVNGRYSILLERLQIGIQKEEKVWSDHETGAGQVLQNIEMELMAAIFDEFHSQAIFAVGCNLARFRSPTNFSECRSLKSIRHLPNQNRGSSWFG